MSTGTGKNDSSAQQAELRRTISHPSNNSIYRPKQAGLKFPELPDFSSFAQERQHRKERLVAACRAFALHHLDYGFAGHLTVRDPEFPELYWTNPMAVHFSQVKLSNLILADHTGKVVEGKYALNRAGFVLHAAVHEANPDIVAMCHAPFYEDHIVIKDEAGAVAVEEEAGLSVADYFKNVKAAIHQNHGLLTVSRHSIEAAAFWFIALERCCQQQLLVEATGIKPVMVPEHSSRYSREHVGSEYIGWLHFQPIYDQLVQSSPDMFD
jgi:ribulose-5-phosphate 4-epimerase/fuculose-1-phosphate aldolase